MLDVAVTNIVQGSCDRVTLTISFTSLKFRKVVFSPNDLATQNKIVTQNLLYKWFSRALVTKSNKIE